MPDIIIYIMNIIRRSTGVTYQQIASSGKSPEVVRARAIMAKQLLANGFGASEVARIVNKTRNCVMGANGLIESYDKAMTYDDNPVLRSLAIEVDKKLTKTLQSEKRKTEQGKGD